LSIFLLLLLVMPVYRMLRFVGVGGTGQGDFGVAGTEFIESPVSSVDAGEAQSVTVEAGIPDRPRRQVDVRIVE
jgi:hypothetical protein